MKGLALSRRAQTAIKLGALVAMGLVGVMVPSEGEAVVYSGTGTTTVPVDGFIDFSATVAGSATLTIVGAADANGCDNTGAGPSGTNATTTLSDVPLGGDSPLVNDVNFGTVDAACVVNPTNGDCCVVAGTGAQIVATLTATVTFSGYASIDVLLCRDTTALPGGDFDAGRINWATGTGTLWTALNGNNLTEFAGADCPNLVAADRLMDNVASGTAVTHQIAFELQTADTSATQGTARLNYQVEFL